MIIFTLLILSELHALQLDQWYDNAPLIQTQYFQRLVNPEVWEKLTTFMKKVFIKPKYIIVGANSEPDKKKTTFEDANTF